MLLHKLRRAMVAPERSPLTGEIEVDDAYIGGSDSGRRGGRDAFGAATIGIVAVEVRGNGSGRIRMEAVDDLSADALCGFVQDNVLEGATVRTDAWQGFKRLARLGYDHQTTSLGAEGIVGRDAARALPRVHRMIRQLQGMVARDLSRRLGPPDAVLPRRVRLPVQPPAHAHGCLSDPARPRQPPCPNHV
jgi:hypothetical protein